MKVRFTSVWFGCLERWNDAGGGKTWKKPEEGEKGLKRWAKMRGQVKIWAKLFAEPTRIDYEDEMIRELSHF